MRKYIKKSKITTNVVLEVPKSTTIGVCTRAKTLASSERFQSPSVEEAYNDDASCYLELRSRRLQKFSASQLHQGPTNPTIQSDLDSRTSSNRNPTGSGLRGSGSVNSVHGRPRKGGIENRAANEEAGNGFDLVVEASSYGESNFGISTQERVSRESTPCSFSREVDVATPGSSTRQQRYLHAPENDFLRFRDIPSSLEMEGFFIRAEQLQQRQQQQRFIEKYNFDIFADTPLPGRYDWFI